MADQPMDPTPPPPMPMVTPDGRPASFDGGETFRQSKSPRTPTEQPSRQKRSGLAVPLGIGALLAAGGLGLDYVIWLSGGPNGFNNNNPGNTGGLIVAAAMCGIGGLCGLAGIGRLVSDLLRGRRRLVTGFITLTLTYSAFCALLLAVGFSAEDNDPIFAIASGTPTVPVLTALAQRFGTGGDGNQIAPILELAVATGALLALLVVVFIAGTRWLHSDLLRRGVWLFLAAGAFALGFAGRWPFVFVAVAAGLVLILLPWVAPMPARRALASLYQRLGPPGVRLTATGRGAVVILASALMVIPGVGAGAGALVGSVVGNFPSRTVIGGYASLAMPLTGATVAVYELNGAGRPSTLLTTSVTDLSGYFAVTIDRHPSAMLLFTTSGGAYVDEVSKQHISAGRSDHLESMLTATSSYAAITPLTTMASARASSLAAAGATLDIAENVSFDAVARQFNLPTITDIYPEVASVPPGQQQDIPDYLSRQLGLVDAGLDQEAAGLGVSELALSDALAADLGDGNLDGKAGSAPVLADGKQLPDNATTSLLQESIDAFAASPADMTGIPAPQIAVDPLSVNLLAGSSLYACTSIIPAFIDGAPGTAPINECGGTPPYSCALVAGGLPPGFVLERACAATYDGRATLGGGHMFVSAPFTVRLSDSSGAAQAITLADLRITTLTPPPHIHVMAVRCPPPDHACVTPIATATGGVPPYTFWPGSGGHASVISAVNLTMRIVTWDSTNSSHPALGDLAGDTGMLSSTPPSGLFSSNVRGGTYPVEVCVVDSVGAVDCGSTSVYVAPPPTPTPSPTEAPTAPATEQPTSAPQSSLPPGFPTDLRDGTYRISICQTAVINQCVGWGEQTIANGDASALVQALSDAFSQAASEYGGTVQYTQWNGQEFDAELISQGQEVLVARITKVS